MSDFLGFSISLCVVAYIRHKEYLEMFGKNILKIREEKGISQEELALNCELSKNQIGRIERGEINAGLSTIYELAQALEVQVKDLFDFT